MSLVLGPEIHEELPRFSRHIDLVENEGHIPLFKLHLFPMVFRKGNVPLQPLHDLGFRPEFSLMNEQHVLLVFRVNVPGVKSAYEMYFVDVEKTMMAAVDMASGVVRMRASRALSLGLSRPHGGRYSLLLGKPGFKFRYLSLVKTRHIFHFFFQLIKLFPDLFIGGIPSERHKGKRERRYRN